MTTLRRQGFTLVLSLSSGEDLVWELPTWLGQPLGLANLTTELARALDRWLIELPTIVVALPVPLIGPYVATYTVYAGTVLVYTKPTPFLDSLDGMNDEAFAAAMDTSQWITENALALAQQYPGMMVKPEDALV